MRHRPPTRDRGLTAVELVVYLFLFTLLAGLMIRAEMLARSTRLHEAALYETAYQAGRFFERIRDDIPGAFDLKIIDEGRGLELKRRDREGNVRAVTYRYGRDGDHYVRQTAAEDVEAGEPEEELLGRHFRTVEWTKETDGAVPRYRVKIEIALKLDKDESAKHTFSDAVYSRPLYWKTVGTDEKEEKSDEDDESKPDEEKEGEDEKQREF